MPRWTPPSIGPSSETSSASKSQVASAAVVVPEAALKEGLNGEALGTPGGAPEPAVGTPDGGSAGGTTLQLDGGRAASSSLLLCLLLFPRT